MGVTISHKNKRLTNRRNLPLLFRNLHTADNYKMVCSIVVKKMWGPVKVRVGEDV